MYILYTEEWNAATCMTKFISTFLCDFQLQVKNTGPAISSKNQQELHSNILDAVLQSSTNDGELLLQRIQDRITR